MKLIEINRHEHSNLNQGIKDLLKWCSLHGSGVEFKLADRMKERNLTVRQLAELSGLRIATISELMNGKKGSINFAHIFLLMMVLRIEKLEDLIDITPPPHIDHTSIKQEAEAWIEKGEIPESTKIYSSIIQGKYELDMDYDYTGMSAEEIWEHLTPIHKEKK